MMRIILNAVVLLQGIEVSFFFFFLRGRMGFCIEREFLALVVLLSDVKLKAKLALRSVSPFVHFYLLFILILN